MTAITLGIAFLAQGIANAKTDRDRNRKERRFGIGSSIATPDVFYQFAEGDDAGAHP